VRRTIHIQPAFNLFHTLLGIGSVNRSAQSLGSTCQGIARRLNPIGGSPQPLAGSAISTRAATRAIGRPISRQIPFEILLQRFIEIAAVIQANSICSGSTAAVAARIGTATVAEVAP